jgi:DNA processing protein
MPAPDPGLAHWLRLARVPGLGDAALRKLLTAFGLPEHVFSASRAELQGVVSEGQAAAIAAARTDADAGRAVDAALEWCAAPGNSVLTLADGGYPRALLEMPDPPPLLFLKGRAELLTRPALAVVGSRNATAQGLANAENFARALSSAGYAVVSGLALGVDAAAHRGGLAGAGSTIAVIGTGADIVYPARNRDLAHAVAAGGLIVSEFALGTPALAANFPRRNRIISGLSRGVLVVEAAQRSGSLITARMAGEQGREVFAIPGSIHSPLSKGCHALIKQGAKLVDSVDDILEELGAAAPRPSARERSDAVRPAADGPKEALLAAMGYDAVGFDALRDRTDLPADVQSSLLMELELEGRVAQLPGGRVQRLEP